MIMTLVALTGAVSHISLGAQLFPLPMAIVVASCLLGAVVSAKFANRCEIRRLNRIVGVSADPAGCRHDPDQAAINNPCPRSIMECGHLLFAAWHKDCPIPDKKFELYEVFSASTAFDTFLLHSVLNCASQRPEDAPEPANTRNKKEITMGLQETVLHPLQHAERRRGTHQHPRLRGGKAAADPRAAGSRGVLHRRRGK